MSQILGGHPRIIRHRAGPSILQLYLRLLMIHINY